jgi:hypothetical protein
MAVELKIGNTLEAGPPKAMFDLQVNTTLAGRWAYQPAADGQRFLVVRSNNSCDAAIVLE